MRYDIETNPPFVSNSSILGGRGDWNVRRKNLQVQQEGDRHSFPESAIASERKPQGQ